MVGFNVHSVLITLSVSLAACGDTDQAPRSAMMANAPENEEAIGYPQGPFGLDVGDIMADQTFETHEGANESFSTLRESPDHRLMLVFVTAGWCSRCDIHMPTLIGTDAAYSPDGLFTAVVIYESRAYGPPYGRDAANFRRAYGLDLPVFADTEATLTGYFEQLEMPMVLVIDLRTMELLYKDNVWAPEPVAMVIDAAL